jgi:hypothetical protein
MLTIKLFGDKHDEAFIWSIAVMDSRGKQLFTDGSEATAEAAKAAMLAALGALVEKLEFSPVDEGLS